MTRFGIFLAGCLCGFALAFVLTLFWDPRPAPYGYGTVKELGSLPNLDQNEASPILRTAKVKLAGSELVVDVILAEKDAFEGNYVAVRPLDTQSSHIYAYAKNTTTQTSTDEIP